MMGKAADESKEDFTLLNLSRSSSSTHSSSEHLFQHPLPSKKKRIRFKRRGTNRLNQKGGTSSQESSQSGHGSSSAWIFGNSNVIYALLIVLLSWSATLSWLVFSLRNQLAETTTQYSHVASVADDLPLKLERLNETVEGLFETNLKTLSSRLDTLQIEVKDYKERLNQAVTETERLKSSLATYGSSMKGLAGKVDKIIANVDIAAKTPNSSPTTDEVKVHAESDTPPVEAG